MQYLFDPSESKYLVPIRTCMNSVSDPYFIHVLICIDLEKALKSLCKYLHWNDRRCTELSIGQRQ